MSENELAVDIHGIAEELHISTETAYRKARLGEIPGFRVGRLWRFFPSKVHEHLERPVDPWQQSPQSRAARRRAS
jgi:excisionase family DNA binding protein